MSRKILITGANRGLGLALTEQLLEAGHMVYALIRHESRALVQLQEKYSRQIQVFTGDVAADESVRQALDEIKRRTGSLDILLNNAAVNPEKNQPSLEDLDFSAYIPTYEINVLGSLRVAKHALPLIRAGLGKLIVNISSQMGSIGSCRREGEYAYSMSKAALNMASQIMQNALGKEGIKVLALNPGWFSSDMGGSGAPITPAVAAERIVRLIMNPPRLDGPVFIDSSGSVLEW
jgi:NAD(P)-dependent dehydrogenase (short-subunit alcohol dehydrogenase family)